ncbi:T-complex protein 1 subunit eta-like [Eurosta solidaginis]|uniref:T-complex protein 1 subunit eta-like n=1 Tax=Eurosta solidaginis TaxID=178769 RepID=UPI0035305F64
MSGCVNARTSTLILRGSVEQFLGETELGKHDAIMLARRTIKHDSVVAVLFRYWMVNMALAFSPSITVKRWKKSMRVNLTYYLGRAFLQ